MDPERKNRYYEKLIHLDKYFNYLNEWLEDIPNLEELENVIPKNLFAVYHAFQLTLEVMADICSMMTKDIANVVKDDYSNFQFLFERKIISKILYKNLKDLNGLRNRVVHDYNGLVDRLSVAGILETREIIPEFKECVQKWLETI